MVRQSPPSCFVRSHESEHSGQLAGHDCPFPLLAFCRWGEHGGRPVADGKIELDPADRGVAGPAGRPLARTTTAGRIWLSQADSAFPIELRKPAHLYQMCGLCWSVSQTCCLWWVKLWTRDSFGLCPWRYAYLPMLLRPSRSMFRSINCKWEALACYWCSDLSHFTIDLILCFKREKLLISFSYLFLWLSAYWDL